VETDNLTGCFLTRLAVIGGINTVKIAMGQGCTDLSAFYGIGGCELKRMVTADDTGQLSEHYLVWYKPNEIGHAGWHVQGSVNYHLSEYVDGLVNGSIRNPEVLSLVQTLSKGLNQPVEILVAFDTSLNQALIVDGTKRALALNYLRRTEPGSLDRLIRGGYPIHVIQFSSTHCSILFPCDFLKLVMRVP